MASAAPHQTPNADVFLGSTSSSLGQWRKPLGISHVLLVIWLGLFSITITLRLLRVPVFSLDALSLAFVIIFHAVWLAGCTGADRRRVCFSLQYVQQAVGSA